MLPLKEAVKLPIWIYGKITFRSLKGNIIIDAPIHTGMIRVGRTDWYVSTNTPQSIWTINGTLKFKGKLNIYYGNYVFVSRSGFLEIGTNGTFIGSNNKIICFDKIYIGDKVELTWECQIMDTSFHYIELIENNNKISPLTKPIVIGDYCWIGNRTTINRGARLPNFSIIASNSLINKDFSNNGSYCLFAGSPATFKMKCKRIYDSQLEKKLDVKYGYDRTHL